MRNWQANLEVVNVYDRNIEMKFLDTVGCNVSCELKKKHSCSLSKNLFDFIPKVGDQVKITIPAFFITKVTLCLFGAPLFCMMVGAYLIDQLVGNETMIIMVAVTGFCLGIILARLYSSCLQKQIIYKLVCSRRII